MIEIQKYQPWMLRLSKQNCSKVKEKLKNINQILPTKINNFKVLLLDIGICTLVYADVFWSIAIWNRRTSIWI